nr:MAG TPA: hypothetical protein [Caudoviricetes sp.]
MLCYYLSRAFLLIVFIIFCRFYRITCKPIILSY